MAVSEFRDAELDFASNLLSGSRALIDHVPGFGVKPIAEFIKRYLVREISPQVVANVRKWAGIHGCEKTSNSRLTSGTSTGLQQRTILRTSQEWPAARKARQRRSSESKGFRRASLYQKSNNSIPRFVRASSGCSAPVPTKGRNYRRQRQA